MKKSTIVKAMMAMIVVLLCACANEQSKEILPPVPATKTDTIPVYRNSKDGIEKTMTIEATVENNGKTSVAKAIGKGEILVTNVDYEGNETVQPYTINAQANATVNLALDTVTVDQFGVELVGYPQDINTEDLTTDKKIGEKTSMKFWPFSDGQTAEGILEYAYDFVATTIAIPHVTMENIRFNKVKDVEAKNDSIAKVTLSFFVNYKSVEANYNPSGELEMLLSYIQKIPSKEPAVEPEIIPDEPKGGPTYNWTLSFTLQEGKGSKPNKLMAEMTVTSSDKTEPWVNSWYAATCGRYQDIEVIYVASDKVVLDKREATKDASKADNEGYEKDGAKWEMPTSCLKSEDFRHFPTTAGGEAGPEQTVYFYTTDAIFTAPTGEKIEVHLHPETKFEEDRYAENNQKGNTKEASGDTYTYLTTLTQSANHYLSCTVVVDGKESKFPIDCLKNGLFRANVATINLYQK